jgi:hypothetical protein
MTNEEMAIHLTKLGLHDTQIVYIQDLRQLGFNNDQDIDIRKQDIVYFSKKNKRTIFLSSRKFPFVFWNYERNETVIEYHPKPAQFKIQLLDEGETREIIWAPDFLVICQDGIYFDDLMN